MRTATNQLVKLMSRRKMSESAFDEMMNLLAAKRTAFYFEDELLGLYAESVGESFFTTTPTETPDCLTCGACCLYFHHILISITDATPRTLAWEVLDNDEQPTYWLRREPGEARCIAFAGQIGEQATCAIYELRPTACRAFEAGSDRCHALRRMYGLEPRLSKQAHARHLQMLKENQHDAIELALPDTLDDESAQFEFLRELVAYNLDKLEAIVTEMKRLTELFYASVAVQAEQDCRRTLEAFAHELSNSINDFKELNAAKPGESLNRFLLIGSTSQAMLEDATRRLAEIGELAFEVLGMKSEFSEYRKP